MPNPSTSIISNEAEGRYFRLFHEELAFDLCGNFETPFWSRLVPQECHHEPAIKHAIFALSALYKSAISSKIPTANTDNHHLNFAMVQQSKAIKLLREALSDGRPQMRLALVASLLFGCFESFHGSWETATQQIYSGINILKSLQEDERERATAGLPTIDLELGLTLGRLKMQIISFLAMSPRCAHPSNDSEDEEIKGGMDIPDRFSTLNEAFVSATSLATSILRHSRTSARFRDVAGHWDSIARQQQCLDGLLDRWNEAYEPFFLSASENTASREYLGALQLRICIWKCEIMIATSMFDEEAVFDNFTVQFQRITYYARHLLKRDNEIRESDGPRVQYGIALIMSLFYTATRCRDFFVRREAIAILREWPCTNGVCHSLQAAKVAEWIVGIEESSCGGNGFIREECRVRMKSLKVDLQKDLIIVECMQPSVDGSLELRQVNLPWP